MRFAIGTVAYLSIQENRADHAGQQPDRMSELPLVSSSWVFPAHLANGAGGSLLASRADPP